MTQAMFRRHGRPLRVLFLGNGDNMNLRLCQWTRDFGAEGIIWRMDEDPQRGNPSLIAPEIVKEKPQWFQEPLELKSPKSFALRRSPLAKRAEEEFDLAIVSGWNALIASVGLKLPKVLVPVGSEVGQLPYCYQVPTQGRLRSRLRQKLDNLATSYLGRRALKECRVIQETWPLYVDILSRLGHKERLLSMSIGEDCKRTRDQVIPELLAKLEKESAEASRVFLWFSRLNFRDPQDRCYKGPERFIQALESQLPALKQGHLKVFMGDHGEESRAFKREIIAPSPTAPFIQWVPHLSHRELISYLSLNKAILFSGFGPHNQDLPGIGRDAVACGTPICSSATHAQTTRQYGRPLPRKQALTPKEIAKRMSEYLQLNEAGFLEEKQKILTFGEEALDYRVVLPRFFSAIQEELF